MKALLVACAVLVLACVVWCSLDLRPAAVPHPQGARADGPSIEPELLESVVRAQARTVADSEQGGTPLVVQLDDEELIALLRATARAYLEQDRETFERNLETLLVGPQVPRRVLEFLLDGRLGAGSTAEQGAILAVGFGVACDARRPALTLGGRPFTHDFLEALTGLDIATGTSLSEFTAALVFDGRPAVGARWLATITTLRERAPERAVNFDPLLHAILESDEELTRATDEMPELSSILANSTDPLAIEAALAVLLATDSASFLPIAEQIFTRSRRHPALAQAVLNAIARHAPVAVAAEALARLSTAGEYGAFARLGSRDGGLDAAQKEYTALVTSDRDPKARMMLVSAMHTEKTEVLLGIAQTDPDPMVRSQALMTLSLKPIDAPEVMRELRGRHAARADGARGMSTRAALSVAENLTMNGSPRLRAEALEWMREVVADTDERLEDRQFAWKKLQARAAPHELAGMEAPR
ncbi:MAG: hypothetical protein JNL28_01655 [Planctomycetes bacterium]|nr:hypothetical protein [Planctomycetota bacterium]